MGKGVWCKRVIAVAALTGALACLTPTAGAQVPVVVLEGTGWGHGVGLSQWGSEYMARSGRSTEEILATFYPGVALADASGPVRVVVHTPGTSTTTLTFPQGGEVRSPLEGPQAPGFPVAVGPGGRVRITFDGAYRVDPLVAAQSSSGAATPYQDCIIEILCPTTTEPPTTTTTAPPGSGDGGGGGGDGGGGGGGGQPGDPGSSPAPPSSAPPPASARSGGPVFAVPASGGVTQVDDRGRAYRGFVEATGGGALRLVNTVGVEDYLRGMSEVPGTWPAAAVQAQTVAARTYALRAMQASGEICDDARCQVYVGATAESPGQNAAVAATAGKVLVYGGALAAAVYSADAGGVSATTLEGFGTPDGVYPYLQARPYDTDNPLPWRLEVSLADVAARLGYPGTLTDVAVAQAGPSARALEMVLTGSAGEKRVPGRTFARALGLRSTRFTTSVTSTATAPAPPPPPEEEIQALPEETADQPARVTAPIPHYYFGPSPASAGAEGLPELPQALDPRRNLLILLAATAAALVAGALAPQALATRRPH